MEGMIASLVKDFEEGRISRRDLIRTIAGVALAGPAAAVSASAAGAQTMPKAPWTTTALDHISYAVRDYRRSAAFYSSLMGWEVVNDNGTNQATLRIGAVGEIIIRNARREGGAQGTAASAPAPGGQSERPPITGVINHVSWGITPWDTDGVKAELEKRGLKPRPDMVGSDFKSFHVLDPDGWDLQISNQSGRK